MAVLVSPWPPSGLILGPSGLILGPLEALVEALKALLERLRRLLGPSGGHLGRLKIGIVSNEKTSRNLRKTNDFEG